MAVGQERLEKARALWTSVSWDEMAAYIGPNADAYRPTWEKHRTSWIEKGRAPGFDFSWCWPALIPILGIPWAAARKQWLFVGMMVAATIAVNILAAIYPNSANFGYMMFLVPAMVKPFYVQQAVVKIARIKETTTEFADQDSNIRNAGGINMAYGYIAGGAGGVLLLISLLFSAISART